MRISTIAIAAVATALASTTVASAQENTGKKLDAVLTGGAEVPGPGDPDGSGSASIRINPGQRQICYSIIVTGIAPATMAHIHEAAADSSGPVVVGLAAPTGGTSQSCVSVTRELALEIIANPSDYYVNVHNNEFRAGAVRGQLGN